MGSRRKDVQAIGINIGLDLGWDFMIHLEQYIWSFKFGATKWQQYCAYLQHLEQPQIRTFDRS
jgi:hypothetical protein